MLMENKEPEGYRDEGTRTTFRESVPERKGVTKVVTPLGKKDPWNQSRRRPLPGYQLSGTERRWLQTLIGGLGPQG